MSVQYAYDYIADYIAMLNPAKLLELRASEEMQQRLEFLIEKEKEEGLTLEEKDELDHYIVLERLVRLAKTRAELYIARA
ncbi:MAG: hypothetical protein SFU99_01530 [Saprospiraceae bacterium]|nr:hypothetical protein [Saprospiraceae bacterium]